MIDALSEARDRLCMLLDVSAIDVLDDVLMDALTTVVVGVGVDMLAGVDFTVLTVVVIDLEFAVALSCAADMLTDVVRVIDLEFAVSLP